MRVGVEKRVICHRRGLAVDTTNPQAIAEAVCRLAGEADLREELGANGRRAIENELGWHKMEEALATIYATLAGSPAKQ